MDNVHHLTVVGVSRGGRDSPRTGNAGFER